jgi:hypothetical protein
MYAMVSSKKLFILVLVVSLIIEIRSLPVPQLAVEPVAVGQVASAPVVQPVAAAYPSAIGQVASAPVAQPVAVGPIPSAPVVSKSGSGAAFSYIDCVDCSRG